MQKVAEFVIEKMEQRGIKQSDLQKELGISKSVISKFLRGDANTDIQTVLKIVRYVCPRDEKLIMRLYCLATEKLKSVTRSFEYCAFNGHFDVLRELIEKHEGDKKLAEWCSVYRVVLRRSRLVDYTELVKVIKDTFTKSDVLRVLLLILEVGCLYKKKQYGVMFLYSAELDEKVNAIEDDFIRNCYKARVAIHNANAELFANNNPEGARKVAEEGLTLELPYVYRGSLTETIGLSYIIDDFDKFTLYLNRAKDAYRKGGHTDDVTEINRTTESFAYNLHRKKYKSEMSSEEEAHALIVSGDIEEGKKRVEAIEAASGETAYTHLYLGMAENNVERLVESMRKFRASGDNFFAQIPYRMLLERGVPDFFLRA
ncbi:AimR family lysis-lysogeny pheromone receptor [Alteribacter populi]|uniref:AimR family lysis-lysogeny pheromone receptor n=1 Tax=Alteribacter populi TaxID=2011011 RepID=UPI000BBB4E5C|nr:AimR family lysis-lysogeny pheromone receptor [Alteribacter populi]